MNKIFHRLKRNPLITLGTLLITAGVLLLFFIFYPVVREEIRYFLYRVPNNYIVITDGISSDNQNSITPIDEQFGIVIPKIGANAPIIPNVDPNDTSAYQKALTKGVAHADGTSLPDEGGSIFLFAHSSSDNFWASRYNAIFYLINKLDQGDEIYIFYNGERYKYLVTNKKIVDAQDVSFLQNTGIGRKLQLMTCYPPGTTLKRLIVEAMLQ